MFQLDFGISRSSIRSHLYIMGFLLTEDNHDSLYCRTNRRFGISRDHYNILAGSGMDNHNVVYHLKKLVNT